MLTAWNFYLKKTVNPIIETSNYASTFTVKMTFCHTEGTTHIKMYLRHFIDIIHNAIMMNGNARQSLGCLSLHMAQMVVSLIVAANLVQRERIPYLIFICHNFHASQGGSQRSDESPAWEIMCQHRVPELPSHAGEEDEQRD